MSITVLKTSFSALPVNKAEILRYAGTSKADGITAALLNECLAETDGKCTGQVCYAELPLSLQETVCDFGVFSTNSRHLSQNLAGCGRVILFAATAGLAPDRLIQRYSRIAPAKALLFQAIGAERIEAVCDRFCEEIAVRYGVHPRPRFSPGYGDLPLSVQKEIFAVLHPQREIGLTLNDSLSMSPSKSVTAFVGLPG